MNKSYKTTIGVFALAAIALVGSQMAVSANQGEYGQKGQGYSEERRATMTQVFADSDYETWKAQMQDRGRMSEDMLTQETFAKMAQVHEKMLAGDYEGAREIRTELGLGQGRGMGQGQGGGMGRHNNENRGQKGEGYSQERRATMTKVFADGDYETWKAQMQDRGRISEDMLTQENFAKMAQVHEKMLAGDYEGAREIRTELGLGQGKGMGQGQGGGKGRHNNENRGQNNGGNFVDANGNGTCDNLNE